MRGRAAPELAGPPGPRRRALAAGAALAALLAAGDHAAAAPAAPQGEGDRIAHPPPREEFAAAGGRLRLVITSVDMSGWASQRSRAEMQRQEGSGWRTLWRLDLPHAYRPRFALASPLGGAALFDEWINIRSERAVVVVDPQGRVVATTPLDTVLQRLGARVSEAVAAARFGWWLQSAPRLSSDGLSAEVQAAGRLLRVRFDDGSLSLG